METVPFPDQLTAWRRRHGLSQDALARRAGMPRPRLSSLENGRSDPTLRTLRRLATALDLSVGELVDRPAPTRRMNAEELDRLARAGLGLERGAGLPATLKRRLIRLLAARRQLLGPSRPRKSTKAYAPSRRRSERLLRLELGSVQWEAVVRRCEKLAASRISKP